MHVYIPWVRKVGKGMVLTLRPRQVGMCAHADKIVDAKVGALEAARTKAEP